MRERAMRAFAPALLGVALAAVVTACTGIKPCAKRGLTESCECRGGVQGVRVCLPERVWDHCVCGETPSGDAGVAGKDGTGGPAGAGGMSGGGGSSGTGAGGGGGSGGSKPPDSDEDAGAEPIGDAGAGTGGMSGGGSGGSAGSAGSAGTGGSGAPASAAYKACTTETDCGAGATCETGTDPDDPFAEVHACAPPCTETSECPVPEGTYEAMIVCVDEHCRLDCTPDLLQDPLSCPAGMRCAPTDALGPSYCF